LAINPSERIKGSTGDNKPSASELDALDPSEKEGSSLRSTGKFQKIMFACVGGGILLVVIILITIYYKSSHTSDSLLTTATKDSPQSKVGKDAPASPAAQSGGDKPWLAAPQQGGNTTKADPKSSPQATDAGAVEDKKDGPPSGEVSPGITDISKDTITKNYTPVEPDTFVKDLNGLPVDEKFDIDSIYSTVDFVSYTKKRASTGDGVELYWLDAQYKGKPAKIQVPFKIFKELDAVGVTAVDVEVVRVKAKDGTRREIATAFVVRTDYKKLLEQRK